MICICIHTLQSVNFSFWNDLEKLAELGNKSAPSSSDKPVPDTEKSDYIVKGKTCVLVQER